jgi:hypothetical protein
MEMPVQISLDARNMGPEMDTNLCNFRLVMFECLAINAHKEHVLNGIFGFDQAQ